LLLPLFTNARSKNIPVTEDLLREKTKQFGSETGVTDFSYSNGWLQLEMPVKNQLQGMLAVFNH
jgi:hypothetical protein